MNLLIIASTPNLPAVEAALDGADPVGAPYRLTRQVSRASDEHLHYWCAHMASPAAPVADAIVSALEDTAGLLVILDSETADDALAAIGTGYRFRPELPETSPSSHAAMTALDAVRGITTTGTIAQRWAQHEADSRR